MLARSPSTLKKQTRDECGPGRKKLHQTFREQNENHFLQVVLIGRLRSPIIQVDDVTKILNGSQRPYDILQTLRLVTIFLF